VFVLVSPVYERTQQLNKDKWSVQAVVYAVYTVVCVVGVLRSL
jgi:hypothetical protein